MQTLPEESNLSLELIDQPDFAETLANDADGTFVAAVYQYLDASQAKIKRYQDAGLSKEDFAAVSRLSESVQSARSFLECFTKLKQLPSLS